jgi:CheY-like chemotaxis protein
LRSEVASEVIFELKSQFWQETCFRRPDGSVFGIWIPADQRVQQQKELQKLQSELLHLQGLQKHFLGNLSHEIRTPLNAILGFSELLKSDSPVDSKDSFLALIQENGHSLLQLMEDLVDLSLLQSGDASQNLTRFDPYLLLEELFEWARLRSEKSEISIRMVRPREGSVGIVSDRLRVLRILQLLVEQSLRSTSSGQITLALEHLDSKWCFWVRDTAIHDLTEEEYTEAMLSEHSQENRLSRLGLTHVFCEAQANFLGLELSKRPLEPIGWEKALLIPVHEAGMDRLPRILVAEDNMANYLVLAGLLDEGVELYHVEDGAAAIQIVRERPKFFDLVIMDLRMPKVNGLEGTLGIRQIDPTLPVIALTAFALGEEVEQAMQVGFADFLFKPATRERLWGAIRMYARRTR